MQLLIRIMLFISITYTISYAQPAVEVGALEHASFRIDIPPNWNGGLILFCHGYSSSPTSYDSSKPDRLVSVFLNRGYAVAQSGFSRSGWAIEEAVHDTEVLRHYFIQKYGKPKKTYVAGASLGGFVTMVLLETSPKIYNGGLALCAPLASSSWFMARRVFDLRVAFDYYFPGVLPSPDKVPPTYNPTNDELINLAKLLQSNPQKTQALEQFARIASVRELAYTIQFFTVVLKDVDERSKSNPFDNRDVIYEGTDDDAALNAGVKRYAADPAAAEYLRKYYTPTGHLTAPLLSLQTVYDPLMPAWVKNAYSSVMDRGTADNFFVQQFVNGSGHCAISPSEIDAAFGELESWQEHLKRPIGGPLQGQKVASEQAN